MSLKYNSISIKVDDDSLENNYLTRPWSCNTQNNIETKPLSYISAKCIKVSAAKVDGLISITVWIEKIGSDAVLSFLLKPKKIILFVDTLI